MVDAAIGVNWRRLSSRRLQPDIVVDFMKESRISKVKLFDADQTVLQVLVETPDDMLVVLGSSPAATDLWLKGASISNWSGEWSLGRLLIFQFRDF
ncbi:glucan endo-1,3-beta-glucosidase 8-like [Elaeis guineensis]|uniref:glucan endo-1,3-beta-glucosidase 8-like n=1 Tax=Elaeis guineensis var. tenera TaxID=51953 RepID=UPI003C6D40AC